MRGTWHELAGTGHGSPLEPGMCVERTFAQYCPETARTRLARVACLTTALPARRYRHHGGARLDDADGHRRIRRCLRAELAAAHAAADCVARLRAPRAVSAMFGSPPAWLLNVRY